MSQPWKWEADKVLPVWEANYQGIWLYVRRHGHGRFSWNATLEHTISIGINDVSGSARSLKLGKHAAEGAALFLSLSPEAAVAEWKRHDIVRRER